MNPIITIDGPSGSGKGTLAARIAAHYRLPLLDSGALYRLLALAAEPIAHRLETLDDAVASELAALGRNLDIAFSASRDQSLHILLNGEDVSLAIRSETIGNRASSIAALPMVRSALLDRQRAFATAKGLVADGRDMGTVVFPDAPIKFYLTASAMARAKRRVNQLQQKAIDVNLDTVLADLKARDQRDTQRTVAPLVAAADALVVDASDLGIEAVFSLMCAHIDKKIQR